MKYSSIKYFCTANGLGVRTAIFVSGCNLHCKGCFNSIAWDFNAGKEVTDEVIENIMESIEPEYIDGLSILGGEPLDEHNVEGVSNLIDVFRNKFGKTKDIWMWSGYYIKEMNEKQLETAKKCDFLIDGRFVSNLYNQDLVFKGSENQTVWKIIDGEFINYEKEVQ